MSEVKPQPLVTFDNDPSNNKEVEEMLDEQIINILLKYSRMKLNKEIRYGWLAAYPWDFVPINHC